MPMVSAKSLEGISGRLGVLAWLITRRGEMSLGRAFLTSSMMFLALRKLARSGVATITISSAAIRQALLQGVQTCGMSMITQGVDWRTASITAS